MCAEDDCRLTLAEGEGRTAAVPSLELVESSWIDR